MNTPEVITVSCPSCGVQVESYSAQLSSTCSFCDTPVVKSTALAPHLLEEVLPFQISQQQASNAIIHVLQNRWFTPKMLREKSKPDEIKGVFVPFWVLKATATSSYHANIGINYQETETYTTIENGKRVTKTRTVTKTDWHDLSGTHVKQYEDHIVCASKALDNIEIDRIEPFDFGKALQFSPEVLAGWPSEIPVTQKEEAFDQAVSDIYAAERQEISDFLTGDSSRVHSVETNVQSDLQSIRAALLPIWISTFRFKGETLRILVNGQTGQVGGDIPRDWTKIGILIAGLMMGIILLVWSQQ